MEYESSENKALCDEQFAYLDGLIGFSAAVTVEDNLLDMLKTHYFKDTLVRTILKACLHGLILTTADFTWKKEDPKKEGQKKEDQKKEDQFEELADVYPMVVEINRLRIARAIVDDMLLTAVHHVCGKDNRLLFGFKTAKFQLLDDEKLELLRSKTFPSLLYILTQVKKINPVIGGEPFYEQLGT